MRCKVCKTKFVPIYPLQPVCLNHTCVLENYNRVTAKKKIAAEKAWQKRKKEGLERLKTTKDYKAEAKRVFQEYVRLRDKDDPCISCPTTFTSEWQGSHYFNANQWSGYIFNELNCHKSCEKCNKFDHGNLIGYREGLKRKIGIEALEKLEAESDQHRRYDYTREELIEIKKKYQKLVNELKKI